MSNDQIKHAVVRAMKEDTRTMNDTEKLAIALATLRDIGSAKMPYWCAENYEGDGDHYSDGGNFDDAGALGEDAGAWYAAEKAHAALEQMGEPIKAV